MSLRPGESFGSYEILSILGRGGMGEVYLALDRRLRRQVAIKVLSGAVPETADQIQRFRKEALFVAVLNHPNICTIYEAGEVNGTAFIAMEYVEGETLRHYLSSNHMPIGEIVDYAIQITDALKEAHEKNVIHRDIKTSNIIVTQRKAIKILDFGLAKQISHLTDEYLSDASTDFSSAPGAGPRGTTPYMSPEILLGKQVDQRSDLFSFGVLLYEMLTGKLPFKGATNIEIIDAILHEDPAAVSRYNDKAPDQLLRILAKLLEKNPEMRYQSAHEAWTDLRKLRGENTRPDTLSPFLTTSSSDKFSFLKTATVAFILASLILTAGYIYLSRSRTQSQTSVQTSNALKTVAVLPFRYTGKSEHKYFGTLVTDALIAGIESEPGLSVAPYVTVRDVGKNESIRQTAKKLGVQWIVRGEVTSNNSTVMIKTEMISAQGKKVWSQEINGSIDGIVSTLTNTKNILISQLKTSETPKGKGVAQLRTPDPEAYKNYVEARTLHERWDKEENLEAANILYRKALQIDPDFGAAHAGLSIGLMSDYLKTRSSSSFVEAKTEMHRALALDPDLPETQIANGLVLVQSGNSIEAKVAFDRALELSPGNDGAFRSLASVYENSGRYAEAKEMYERAIELRPTFWANHYQLGAFLYQYVGNYQAAREPLKRATELYPEGTAAFVVLGLVDLTLGELDAAESAFRKVMEKESNQYAQNALGIIYYYRGNYDLALRNWENLLNKMPDHPSFNANVADALRGMKQHEKAAAHYEKAVEQFRSLLNSNPDEHEIRAGLAMALSAIDRCEEAKKEIRTVLRPANPNATAVAYAAVAASRCKDKKWATELILKAINLKNVVDIRFHPDLEQIRQDPKVKKALAGDLFNSASAPESSDTDP